MLHAATAARVSLGMISADFIAFKWFLRTGNEFSVTPDDLLSKRETSRRSRRFSSLGRINEDSVDRKFLLLSPGEVAREFERNDRDFRDCDAKLQLP